MARARRSANRETAPRPGSELSADANPYRALPAVEEALEGLRALEPRVGRPLLVAFVQAALAGLRGRIAAERLDAAAVGRLLACGELARAVEARVRAEEGAGIRPAVNAAGVVLHTGLGRAPVHPEAARAMERAARGYCVLEVDRSSGERGQRDARLGELFARLTGAEAGIAVNNNAAAVLLALNTFAAGRETVVSRGELVEIGGSFRMPAVMERAGTRLVEVGTTNRTRLEDYRAAIGPGTGLVLKVHTSNFRVVGFTEEADLTELVELGHERGVPVVFDVGSGLVEEPGADLGDEPRVRGAVASGADLVTFSGDKLLGGPQAGLLVGRAEAVERARRNPLYRALRLDKVALAGLEATVGLLLAGRGAELPVRRMLARGAEELEAVARELAARLGGIAGLAVTVEADASQPGSGSAPGVLLPTRVVRVRAAELSADELAARLRAAEPPVFARIQDGALLLDPRTLLEGDADAVVGAFRAALAP